jgi:hypothetical protein
MALPPLLWMLLGLRMLLVPLLLPMWEDALGVGGDRGVVVEVEICSLVGVVILAEISSLAVISK